MALELAPAIRVNAACPGYVLTPMPLASSEAAYLTGAEIPVDGGEIAGLV